MPRVEKKVLQAFTPDQVQQVLHHCEVDRDRAVCLFLLDSGVRASELIAINMADVDLSSGSLQPTTGLPARL